MLWLVISGAGHSIGAGAALGIVSTYALVIGIAFIFNRWYASSKQIKGKGMLSNLDIVEMLETEGTLDFLLLDYDGDGLDPSEIEDEILADMFIQAKEVLYEIRKRLEPAKSEYYGAENDSAD